MPLGINTNLSAQGIIKNLEASQAQFNRSVSRLSSGLRINSAADDPAGLIQAQKYQSQVNGLGQAISNARDAINLVQTAEGAMDQISAQLQSMRTLALHAANAGVNDSTAQSSDQAQIRLALQSIDRIVSNTQFGNKKLLDGTAGTTGTATNTNVGFVSATSSTAAGTYDIKITQVATQGQAQGVALKQAKVTGAGGVAAETADAAATLKIKAGVDIGGTGLNVTVNIGGLNLDDTVAAINNTTALNGIVTASKSGDNLVLTSTKVSGAAADLKYTLTNAGANVFGLTHTAEQTSSLAQAASTAQLAVNETLTFGDGVSKSTTVALLAGTTLSTAVYQTNTALTAAGIGMTASLDASGKFTVTNNSYGSATNVKNTMASSLKDDTLNSLGLIQAAGVINTNYNIADVANAGNLNGQTVGADVAGTFSGNAATGVGQVLTGDTGSNTSGLSIRFAGTSVPANNDGGQITVTNNSLVMQLGAFAGQTATVGISSMATADLGKSATGTTVLSGTDVKLSNIDVTTGTNGSGAADAIRIIDAAIAQVASLRGDLGAFQTQTLEATVKSSQVAQNNLTTTLSDIQDANMAQESTAFSRAQILQQQSISMLSQANSSGQLLLRLFQ